MIKRLSTAAIGVALFFSTNTAHAGPYYGFDGRHYGEPVKVNWGRPEAKNAPRVADAKGAPRGCLSKPARELLEKVESRFGPVKVISTCRPGARIAGSGRISRHASGNAVDFDAGNRKSAIINWLVANHKSGGTMTYPDMSHIHIDIGQHFVSLAGGRKFASWSGGGNSRSANANSASVNSGSSNSGSVRSVSTRTASNSGRRGTVNSGRYYEEARPYGRPARSYVAYEGRYSSEYSRYSGGYGRSGNADYSNGYATIYR